MGGDLFIMLVALLVLLLNICEPQVLHSATFILTHNWRTPHKKYQI